MSKRKAGYYWIRDGQGWEPLRWSGCVWDGHFNDADLEEIGPRIPTPDEPWQCVPTSPTPEMTEAAEEGHMPFGDMGFAIQCAIVNTPKPEDV